MQDLVSKIVRYVGASAIVMQIGVIGYAIGYWQKFWDTIDLKIADAHAASLVYTDNAMKTHKEVVDVEKASITTSLTHIQDDIRIIKEYIARSAK